MDPQVRVEAAVAEQEFRVRAIGWVESPLVERAGAPRQGDEGGPEAWVVFEAGVERGLRDLAVGQEVLLLTWLHQADREVLAVHPRGERSRPETGVFATRSPDRPNPIGLHRVTVLAVDGPRLRVEGLEAIDGTPVLDVKPVLPGLSER
ncbi:tRNA (N6-threonylcarbamoyladenosine(37)-N6)-methyltransferase TrmO [Kitasatospora sp. NPDC057542]|uniref:tRNA (N6-threonylcarbamoyladenosine(37)-N6)-methyltransferase TrmO n=1 Tax=Streptomycetaceae TaxID=2062 RepID=UPI001CC9FF62|nr:tRNA (N6-threonylcarbamoyladenosine(37)-N6)-methyltransferase TrmO [Streptomyces sp. LS1784]